jgi:hypothetical protein
LLEKSANRFGIRAWFKERVFGRKFEDKAEDLLKKKPWPAQAI